MYWLAYYVVRYRRKVVFAHLKQAFPERSETDIKQIAKGFYRNFEISLIIKESLIKLLMSCVRVQNTFCQGASRRLHAVAIQRAEQRWQGVFWAEPLRAGFLRAICCVEVFAKV